MSPLKKNKSKIQRKGRTEGGEGERKGKRERGAPKQFTELYNNYSCVVELQVSCSFPLCVFLKITVALKIRIKHTFTTLEKNKAKQKLLAHICVVPHMGTAPLGLPPYERFGKSGWAL